MAVELGGVSLEHLSEVSVHEAARIARHAVPGMQGDLAQTLGRPAVEVRFRGIFYGETAADDLKQLRDAHLKQQPVDFFTEAAGEGYFAQVLVAGLEVAQRAGYPDEFDYCCTVVEYVEPPEPAAADPLALPGADMLDASLLDEAAGFMDDVQNTLDQVTELTDLIASLPSFGDPTEALGSILGEYSGVAGEGAGALKALQDLI